MSQSIVRELIQAQAVVPHDLALELVADAVVTEEGVDPVRERRVVVGVVGRDQQPLAQPVVDGVAGDVFAAIDDRPALALEDLRRRRRQAVLDVRRAATRYALDMSAWLRFRELVETPWVQIRYEDVVTNMETEVRRALETLGLPWNDAALAYRQRLAADKRVTSDVAT